MNGKIRLIGLDLDGTLLNGEKRLTEYTERVLLRAASEGVVLVISTGRPVCAVPEELLRLPGIRYAVTANGARIISLEKGDTLYTELMPQEKAQKILDILYQYDSHKEIFIDGKGYSDRETMERLEDFHPKQSAREYVKRTRSAVEHVAAFLNESGKAVDKINTVFASDDEHRKAWEEINALEGYEVTASYARNIEINEAGADKGKGLIRLGRLLGICQEEIMACGDGLNDVGMIKAAGLGVAMGNAIPQVKEAADYITDTNEEDGAAKAIERLVLHKKGE